MRDLRRSTAAARSRAEAAENGRGKDQNKATARVLTVLSAFATDAEAYGVTELSLRLGMTKNMVHRALTTLLDQGYLVRDEAGQRYELGYRVVELQNPHVPEPDLRSLCAPSIRDFHRVTGETVSLCVRRGDIIVFVDGFETRKPSVWRLEIGDIRPLHSGTASSNVVLAGMPDAEIADYVRRQSPMRLRGGETLDEAVMWAEIGRVRERGYAMIYRPGALPMVSVAFAIRDPDERVQGSIAVGGPVERFDRRLKEVLPELEAIVRELNSRTRLYPLSGALAASAS
ncbi:MAG TPA: IclR family transcriptional regulator [Stellaceae bacterium]|nr:IclR family transcriptional regulator [Stellaceae bacterium]